MKGLLLIWTHIPAELEQDFNEWYNRGGSQWFRIIARVQAAI